MRHQVGAGAEPYICGSNYPTADASTYSASNIEHAPVEAAFRFQIYAVEGEAPGDQGNRGNHGEASSSHDRTELSVSPAEWDEARNAIVNNTRLPLGASPGTLNAYHSMLERNRTRLRRAEADLARRQEEAAASSEHHANRPPIGSSGSRSNISRNVFQSEAWKASQET